METIVLSPLDLSLGALLVLALAATTAWMRLGVQRQVIIAAIRATVQLLLIGLVLKALFENIHLGWMALLAVVMLTVATRETLARQKNQYAGWWRFGIGGFSMFISSMAVTMIALTVIVRPVPWYQPQYAVPLLGMIIGNNMNGVALGLNHLTQAARRERGVIEARLILGGDWREASGEIQREAMRTGMIPIINSMAASGIVKLPGMMTGQILAGNEPVVAVSYQILVMFLLTVSTGFSVVAAVRMGTRRLFDERDRLRLERLKVSK